LVTRVQGDSITVNGNPVFTESNLNRNYKNYIVNPGFRISQENGTANGTAAGYFSADQWPVWHSHDGTLTSSSVESATPGGSTHRLRSTVTSTDSSLAASQYVQTLHLLEGTNIADLKFGTADAKDAIVRFGWNSPAGTYSVSLRNGDSTRSYVRDFEITGDQANTDTLQTLVFPGDTTGTWGSNTSACMTLSFCIGTGSDYRTTADGWRAGNYIGTLSTTNIMATSGAVVELFDVGLYADLEGTGAPPPFILPDYGEDLRDCQRYYYKINTHRMWVSVDADSYRFLAVPHPVPMRTTPTLSGSVDGSGTGLTSFQMTDQVASMYCTQASSASVHNVTASLSARM
jgi:hypothetical protein